MKKAAQRTPTIRAQKLGVGVAASSGSLVIAVFAAREMGGPILAAGFGVGLAALAAILLFVFRDRSPAPAPALEAKTGEDGAVAAVAAL